MRRAIIILIVLLICLTWLSSSGTIRPMSQPRDWQGLGREPVVSVVISSSRIALTWGLPVALIYQVRTLLN